MAWQLLIDSVTALVALIGAALFNFWFNRRRDAALRWEEMIFIASAFCEVTAMQREAARIASIIARFDHSKRARKDGGSGFTEHYLPITQLPASTYFDHLSSKVGLLPPGIALGVIRFYQRIDRARTWIPALADDPERKFTWSSCGALRPLCQAVHESGFTLLLLEKLLGLESFEDPKGRIYDISEAVQIVDEEDSSINSLHTVMRNANTAEASSP